jgi:hypothetical protein
MTQHATAIVRANMPMDKSGKAGERQYHHHQQKPVSLPSASIFVNHKGIILRGIRRHNIAILPPEVLMRFTRLIAAIVCTAILLSLSGCGPRAVSAAPLSPNYTDAQNALAADNFGDAKKALKALAAESTGDFQRADDEAASAPDIDSMRTAFRSASDILIKNGVPAEYAVAYCPMYKGGSSWVQKKGDIVNPYTGKSMPGCGVFKK